MASSVFEEALADAKKLREVAEQNAKNAILEAVTPKIKKFIEDQLIGESGNLDEIAADASDDKDDEDVLTDVVTKEAEECDEKEDLDEEFVLTPESASRLVQIVMGRESVVEESNDDVVATVTEARQTLEQLATLAPSSTQLEKLRQLRALIEAAHENLQTNKLVEGRESLVNELDAIYASTNDTYNKSSLSVMGARIARLKEAVGSAKSLCESASFDKGGKKAFIKKTLMMLGEAGSIYKIAASLNERFDEQADDAKSTVKTLCREIWTMSKKQGSILNEEDVLLKLNLPDDIELDLETLSVDVLPADGEEPMGDDVGLAPDMAGDAPPADVGADVSADMAAGAEDVEEEDEIALEGLDDDDVVEISESMLRAELKKMREGKATDPKVVEDFGGGHAEEEPFLNGKVTTESETAHSAKVSLANAGKQVAALKVEVNEGKRVIAALQKQLAEVNLFNAKLLYANKVLQSNEMTGRQKIRVIESLDKAKTLREVKLLYKSLTESIGGGNAETGLNESAGSKKVIGSASRPTKPAARVNEGVETDRWAKLAGLKD